MVCFGCVNVVVPVMYVCGLWLVVAEGMSVVYLVLFRGDLWRLFSLLMV